MELVVAVGNSTEEKCIDFQNGSVSSGQLYIPGSDPCIVCLCNLGLPLWCQAVRCAVSRDCMFFTTGRSCCEFVCLDSALEVFCGFCLLSLILLVMFTCYLRKRNKQASSLGTLLKREGADLSLISPSADSNQLTKI